MFSGFTSCESVLPDWSDTITGVASLGSSLQAEIFPFFAFVYTCAVPAFLCCTVAPRQQHVAKGFQPTGSSSFSCCKVRAQSGSQQFRCVVVAFRPSIFGIVPSNLAALQRAVRAQTQTPGKCSLICFCFHSRHPTSPISSLSPPIALHCRQQCVCNRVDTTAHSSTQDSAFRHGHFCDLRCAATPPRQSLHAIHTSENDHLRLFHCC